MTPRVAPTDDILATDSLLARAAEALNAGDFESARSLLASLLQSKPLDPNVRLLSATLARRDGRLHDSLDVLTDLRLSFPEHATIAFQLGNTLKDLQRPVEAIELYRSVLLQRPEHADAAFNLGTCLRHAGAVEAGRWFLHAARLRPLLFEALQQSIDCAAEFARRNRQPPAASRQPPAANQLSVRPPAPRHTLVSVVCCSIDAQKLDTLRRNLHRVLQGMPWELIHIGNARSLSEGYNRGIRRTRGEVIILCHDDIRVLAPDFGIRLLTHLERFDLVGVAGTTRCAGPAALWSGPPHAHGWITYRSDAMRQPSICSAYGPVIADAQALDGVFLAARRSLLQHLHFDELA